MIPTETLNRIYMATVNGTPKSECSAVTDGETSDAYDRISQQVTEIRSQNREPAFDMIND